MFLACWTAVGLLDCCWTACCVEGHRLLKVYCSEGLSEHCWIGGLSNWRSVGLEICWIGGLLALDWRTVGLDGLEKC